MNGHTTFSDTPPINANFRTAGGKKSKAFCECKGCGRLTPRNEPNCTHCGKRNFFVRPLFKPESTEARFIREFFSRATPVAYSLFTLNLVIYLLMAWFTPGQFVENLIHGADETTLASYGAISAARLANGEWFRLWTAIFLHLSGLHFISNTFAMTVVGPQVERLYGSARFLLIFLLAGMGGTIGIVASQQINGNHNELAVGASGAIFGLFGVLAVFGFKYRTELPASFRRSFMVAVIPAIAVNLFIGFSISFIDNSVHVGGLLAGIALTWLIPYLAPGKERPIRLHMSLLTACAVVVFYCYGRAYVVQSRTSAPVQQAQLNEIQAFNRGLR